MEIGIKLYKIMMWLPKIGTHCTRLQIFSHFLKATAEFLTHEETVPLLRKRFGFKDYTFFKRGVLVKAVECLPDDPYNDSASSLLSLLLPGNHLQN